ncbi:MAG: hypothetical protein EBW55_09480 [Betaproteobacteria bacterium]|nr:hypothetical protein [Betaproteobacteria bacterium]NCW17930.1 hypothetical protein [Betaproteobacteria bacterium]NCW98251.1 hypothetical protein [Betaproteobacteria bacterium]
MRIDWKVASRVFLAATQYASFVTSPYDPSMNSTKPRLSDPKSLGVGAAYVDAPSVCPNFQTRSDCIQWLRHFKHLRIQYEI